MLLSDLLEQKRLTSTFTQPILLDADVAVRCARARTTVENAQAKVEQAERVESGRMQQPRTVKARQELEAAKAEQESADSEAEQFLVDFVFESVGSTRWDELLEEHESPAEQKERLGKDDPGYDTKTWPLAVVAECLKSPEVSGAEDVAKLKADAPDAVWDQILTAAIRVNRGANQVPKSLSGWPKTESSEPK